ncbi:MAG: sigma factor-like helix-turn-helix DNA-binding protein [Actinomycetota bacterium]
MTFETFLAEHRARLTAGLVATYGPEVGQEAAAEAVAYGWQHWDRLRSMDNPAGYLYRVGQTTARGQLRPTGFLPQDPSPGLPDFEPGLAPALEALSEQQRACVVLVHALGWSKADAARLLDIDVSTLRTHVNRGLDRLRTSLKVEPHVQ